VRVSDVASLPTVTSVLGAAVAAIDGAERPGQVQMAKAVADALRERQHLLVQAGTGTGKSLGYLVPSLLHPRRVVIATATLALQHQLVERDLPALVEGVRAEFGSEPTYAVLKGRSNYACLHRVREGAPDDQGTLVEVPTGSLGEEVLALRRWAEAESEAERAGDRDSAPTHAERAWAQVSVSARECLGAQRCPFAVECFAERAREEAMNASLVVTNHALLAIDAIDGVPMLPEYDAVVVDEAHELTARVTQSSTDELSPAAVERAARRCRSVLDDPSLADDLVDAADALRDAIRDSPPGRMDVVPQELEAALLLVREQARRCFSSVPREQPAAASDGDAVKQQAKGMLDEVRQVAERLSSGSEHDVRWVAERDPSRGGNELRVAPLDVASTLRERLFARKTVVLTSATLKLGGGFDPVAVSLGLRPEERLETAPVDAGSEDPGIEEDTDVIAWRALDVGSPFDYARQAILYVAKHLPTPGRDGAAEATLKELTDLVAAAGGRTLGLFSSRRAAEAATLALRSAHPELPVACQGEAQLPELARRFVEDPHASLFGTLSLWQGIDLPGVTCQLVLIDRIPFPRPDDPLMSARQRAVERRGGNGFMSIAATHAALLLAQGTGRLIRRSTDRGVVAVLDPRLVTARYGSFLAASLPPMWRTTDPAVARSALSRLDTGAGVPA
jgi:ATP-dependent DNA helicase DinG